MTAPAVERAAEEVAQMQDWINRNGPAGDTVLTREERRLFPVLRDLLYEYGTQADQLRMARADEAELFRIHQIPDDMVEQGARVLTGLSDALWEQAREDDNAALDYYRDAARSVLRGALGAQVQTDGSTS
jgi:hypothetical protein